MTRLRPRRIRRRRRRDLDIPEFRGGAIEVLDAIVQRFGIRGTVGMLTTIAEENSFSLPGTRTDPKWVKNHKALEAALRNLRD